MKAGGEKGRPLFWGAVFCGGQSLRMGRDKAQLVIGEKTLLERAVGVLDQVCDEVVLACGPKERYTELGLRCIVDRFPEGLYADGTEVSESRIGPLAGLWASLEALSERVDGREEGWLAVLAVDLVRAQGALFEGLLQRGIEENADACLLESGRGREPLFAVYRPSCLESVRAAIQAGERRLVSFHRGYGDLHIASYAEDEIPPELRVREPARNVNSPEEFLREGGAIQ